MCHLCELSTEQEDQLKAAEREALQHQNTDGNSEDYQPGKQEVMTFLEKEYI